MPKPPRPSEHEDHEAFLAEVRSLQERYDALKDQRIRNEERLQAAERNLAELRARAVEAFGTDDIDELRKLLAKQEKENEKNRKAYEKHLDEVEAKIASVEADYEAEDA